MKRRIKLAYIIAYNSRWPSIEWICQELDRGKFELSFILLNSAEPPLAAYLNACAIPYVHVRYSGKSNLGCAIRQVYHYCRRNEIDILHAHFVNACLAGLTGAFLAGVRVRVHTRHHAGPLPWSHRPPWGRLYDRLNNALSTAIIAPSEEARRALISGDGVTPGKVALIHHGFDLEAFERVSEQEVRALRRKYNIRDEGPVIGTVARYEKIKGLTHVISAFKRLLSVHPSASLVLAHARGKYQKAIRKHLQSIPPDKYIEIPFENNVFALYRLFDVFVHTPVSPAMEGFGQVYVEALASGVPSVVTRSGVAVEFINHKKNAYVVDYRNSDQIYEGMRAFVEDREFRESVTMNGRESVRQKFGVKTMIRSLENLYIALAEGGKGISHEFK